MEKRESGVNPERSGHCEQGALSQYAIVYVTREGVVVRRSVSQETCLMKYVDASGQSLSTQMEHAVSAENSETLFVRSGPYGPLFVSYGGYSRKMVVEPAHFMISQDLRVSKYEFDQKKE